MVSSKPAKRRAIHSRDGRSSAGTVAERSRRRFGPSQPKTRAGAPERYGDVGGDLSAPGVIFFVALTGLRIYLHRPAGVMRHATTCGGDGAMNVRASTTPLVLLCPAWKKWGTARTVKPGTLILHSRGDDMIPLADSDELVRISGLPTAALIEVGSDHRVQNVLHRQPAAVVGP